MPLLIISAKMLNGAGLYLEDSAANSESLLKKIEMLINDREFLDSVQQKALGLAKYDGVKGIINQIKNS